MRSRIYATVNRQSVCPIDQQRQWCAAGLLLSDSMHRRSAATAATALSSKCGQCRVDSRGMKLNTDLLRAELTLSSYANKTTVRRQWTNP